MDLFVHSIQVRDYSFIEFVFKSFFFRFHLDDSQHVQNLHDPKQLIQEYQLNKSQLIFTIVELNDDKTVVSPFDQTSVETRVMIDNSETNCRKFFSHTRKRNRMLFCLIQVDSVTERLNNQVKCIPQKGNWQGSEDVVIIMPHSIKKKGTISSRDSQHR